MRKISVAFILCAALTGCGEFIPPGTKPLIVPPAPIVPEPTQCGGWVERPVAASPVGTPIVGAADFHNHQFANLGFGGRFLSGKAFDAQGIGPALAACTPAHGDLGVLDPVGLALGQGTGHMVSGYPGFVGWPHWSTYTHQQVYHRWLRRAFDGGLKLIVMHAVSNQVLCQFLGHSHACDDMTNVDLQLAAARELENFIDLQNDCQANHNGWYRIATSPQQAREIIADGAMAVVLGIEVDTLFNCSSGGSCTPASVAAKIAEYKAKGVTHLFPVHLFDNAFGGTAVDNDFFNFGNVVVNHKLLAVADCSDKGYEFHFGDASDKVNEFLSTIATAFGVAYPRYPKNKAHCNTQGLTTLGEAAIVALMDAHMIIDVDHMSAKTRARVIELAQQRGYHGLVSGHTGFTELDHGDKKHEGNLTPSEVATLVAQGGLLAPILNQGNRKQIQAYERPAGTRVANECGNSAMSFAQAYLYAVDHAAGRGVGFGSDLNGLAGSPTPRFGDYACGGDDGEEQTQKVQYPIALYPGLGDPMAQAQAGQRKFDINVDGFAHVGMFPDFVAELRAIGLTDADLAPLFSSAESYIRLWESVEPAPLAPNP